MRTATLFVMSAMLVPFVAHTDGGTICLSEASGELLVTVFAAPRPLRAGPIDLSVLVQHRTTGAIILDAKVDLAIRRLDGGGPRLLTHATRKQATNKLLQSGRFELPAAGSWAVQVFVSRGQEEAAFATILEVAPATPRLAAIWPLLLLPPCAILLFALHQVIRRPA
jgi:hypothetical protein